MYTVRITKRHDWTDEDGPIISEEEFKSVEQELNDPRIPKYKEDYGNIVRYFTMKGRINVDGPSDAMIEVMTKVAQKLSAKVQGDGYELFADFTESHSPHKPAFRKLMGANLPEGFPIIDNFNRLSQTVTKMEVVDLQDPAYRDVQTLYEYGKESVERMGNLGDLIWEGYKIRKGREYTNRQLMLGIPEGTVTPAQKDTLIELQKEARDWHVRLLIVEFSFSVSDFRK